MFAVDIGACPVTGCSGAMRIREIATAPDHIARVLMDLGLVPRPPPKMSKIPARQLALPLKN